MATANYQEDKPYTQIMPRSEGKGIDILGTNEYTYIIRSELGCIMRVQDLHKASENNVSIIPIHPTCANGDHYFSLQTRNTFLKIIPAFYIIKDKTFREVWDLSTDEHPTVGTLHPNCRGGNFYLGSRKYNLVGLTETSFIIVRASSWTYDVFSDLQTGKKTGTFQIHRNCRGSYYWASERDQFGWATGLDRAFGIAHYRVLDVTHYYILQHVDEWGLHVHHTTNLTTDQKGEDLIVQRSVVDFLPGGIAVSMGAVVGKWELLLSIDNRGKQTEHVSEKTIEEVVGYKKSAINTEQHHWNCKTELKKQLGNELAKVHLSLSAEYGGYLLNTNQQDWTEETRITTKHTFNVAPGESSHVWHYKITMGGKTDVLNYDSITITGSPNPPTHIPAVVAKKEQ